MKRLILTQIFLIISYCFAYGNTWENINEKTWISRKDFTTNQYVFYETANGLKKAIYQINGSGRCAVLSLIFDVKLKGDTIYLKNGLNLDIKANKDTELIKSDATLYLKNDSVLIASDFEYEKGFNDARICNWIESYSGYQMMPIQELKKISIEEKQIYDILSFNLGPNPENCGIDNKPELSEKEAIFFNEYLKIPAQLKKFDFYNKKVLFVTGSSGNTLGSKIDYFNDVREWREKYNSKIATSLIVLDDNDKAEYGYDAIVTFWVKIYNPKTKRALKQTKNE
jgi:hypothetical protein